MQFSDVKLPKTAAIKMQRVGFENLRPYALMLSPIYALLRRNEKFIAVKSPLDFFHPEELEKIRPLGALFVPPFVNSLLPFQDAAKSVRALLTIPEKTNAGMAGYPQVDLPPTPYELSDAILQTIGPLWGKGGVLEPFFVVAFVQDLCDPMPANELIEARDRDVDRFEKGLFVASWAVFFALHLGMNQLGYLNHLYRETFQACSQGKKVPFRDFESAELVRLIEPLLNGGPKVPVEIEKLGSRTERIAKKLISRMARVEEQFIDARQEVPTIIKPDGFVNG